MASSETCADRSLLPLEAALCFSQYLKPRSLPSPQNHFDRYRVLKQWLTANIYRHIGAGSSVNTPGDVFFTDHGADHFDQVIKYAGKLANIPEDPEALKKYDSLNGYELFLTLSAILLHDAGNVYGRDRHEKKPLELLREIGPAFAQDNIERRLIAGIAEVHGGHAPDGTKDTIGAKQWKDQEEFAGVSYRPNLVAALIRFADEICEDRSRVSPFLLSTSAVPEESLPYHKYANTVTSVNVDRRDKSIVLTYDIESTDLLIDHCSDGHPRSLVDIIMDRLEKMDLERRYCVRYLAELAPLMRVRAQLTIYHEDQIDKRTMFLIEDCGYPDTRESVANAFFRSNPDWQTQQLLASYAEKSNG